MTGGECNLKARGISVTNGDRRAKKITGAGEGESLSLTRLLLRYRTVKELHKKKGYTVRDLCPLVHIARSSYYKWLKHPKSSHELENEKISTAIQKIYKEHPDKGHRRIRDDLEKDYDIRTSNKRVLNLCRVLHIQSTVKFRKQGCTRNASDPQVTAQNRLHREFWAGHPNEKWLTDVTEFKWYEGPIIHKLYLSAILDLCDRRIVSYVIRDRNDNKLVFDTPDRAVLETPNAHPLFHSDRGFQYTSRTFHKKLLDAGMTQSMSRVGRCIDNGPMEGFWGILKRECYYGHTFTSREQLISTIESYIDYYNNRRYQHRLFIQTPMQAHVSAMNRAA